jgi:hypothetical protein
MSTGRDAVPGRVASGPLSRRRVLLALGALPLTTALSGCLLNPVPTTPAPPTPTPTPRPTPTPPVAPVPVALPTATTGVPPTAASRSTPFSASDPRGAGALIYAGKLNGRAGIVAVRAGGGSQLLTEGSYTQLAWAPDGSRFAAVGPLPGEAGNKQVALFAFNGRPLARYPVRGDVDRGLLWSPDSQYLLCIIAPENGPLGTGRRFAPWVFGDDAARELSAPGEGVGFRRWISRSRVLCSVRADGTLADPLAGTTPVALLTIDAVSGETRRVTQGAFLPIGLSPAETTLYALADPALIDLGAPNVHTEATSLVAIDLPTGSRRILASIANLVAAAPADRQYWLSWGSITPNGARIALVLSSAIPSGVPGTAALVSGTFVIVNSAGGSSQLLPDTSLGFWSSWSPDSTKLASFRVGAPNGENELRILDAVRGDTLTYPLDAAYTATLGDLAWSNDSRWLAYRGPRGLEIVATGGTRQSFPVAEDGIAPAWRPGGRA